GGGGTGGPGRPGRRVGQLGRGASLGRPEGYVRVFADEGAPMARLLSRLVTARRAGQVTLVGAIPLDYLDRLALAFRPGSARLASRPARHTADVAAAAHPPGPPAREVPGLLVRGECTPH